MSCLKLCNTYKASLAQLVEQLTLNQFVRGSSPRGGTEKAAFRLPFLFLHFAQAYITLHMLERKEHAFILMRMQIHPVN